MIVGYGNDCYNTDDNHEIPKTPNTLGGITVWSTSDWKRLEDLKIGEIMDVHFNSTAAKVIAAAHNGKISVVDLE